MSSSSKAIPISSFSSPNHPATEDNLAALSTRRRRSSSQNHDTLISATILSAELSSGEETEIELPTRKPKKKTRRNTIRSMSSKGDNEKFMMEKLSSLSLSDQESRMVGDESGSSKALYGEGSSSNNTTPSKKKNKGKAREMQPPAGVSNVMNGSSSGMNGSSSNLPLHAGQQMDLNFIYGKVLELSEQLAKNRAQTAGVLASAEELAKRAAAKGRSPTAEEAGDAAIALYKTKIADLEYKLADSESLNEVLFREQRENGKLIGEYEQGVEKILGILREVSFNKEMEKAAVARKWLAQLNSERDDHFKTRMERDQANAHIIKLVGQMRQTYKMMCEEDGESEMIVCGLQNEVRMLRSLAGLPKEKFEDEFGYPILKYIKDGDGNNPAEQ